ncbi:hypothetical protein J437_LFUL015386 [Ladona fulva]|uniref:Nucleic-acid-binding protein from mobile element jockey n=1 Tax=Ladona fulva TaxID=123851 RepID=A0A8K0KIA1_LADFU|nr:hypothetical protein J437_LFUL015386 [Ladona fulva]
MKCAHRCQLPSSGSLYCKRGGPTESSKEQSEDFQLISLRDGWKYRIDCFFRSRPSGVSYFSLLFLVITVVQALAARLKLMYSGNGPDSLLFFNSVVFNPWRLVMNPKAPNIPISRDHNDVAHLRRSHSLSGGKHPTNDAFNYLNSLLDTVKSSENNHSSDPLPWDAEIRRVANSGNDGISNCLTAAVQVKPIDLNKSDVSSKSIKNPLGSSGEAARRKSTGKSTGKSNTKNSPDLFKKKTTAGAASESQSNDKKGKKNKIKEKNCAETSANVNNVPPAPPVTMGYFNKEISARSLNMSGGQCSILGRRSAPQPHEETINFGARALARVDGSRLVTRSQNRVIVGRLNEAAAAPFNSRHQPPPALDGTMPQIELNNEEIADKLLNIRHICGFIVKIEKFKPAKGPPQCQRCQKFGHVDKACKMPAACVKCGLGHLTRECSKPANEKAKCVNCQGEHPASYRGCPFYQTLKNKIKLLKEKARLKLNPNRIANSNFELAETNFPSNSTRSYAQAASELTSAETERVNDPISKEIERLRQSLPATAESNPPARRPAANALNHINTPVSIWEFNNSAPPPAPSSSAFPPTSAPPAADWRFKLQNWLFQLISLIARDNLTKEAFVEYVLDSTNRIIDE